MGVTTQTVTTYLCDRCGHNSADALERGGYAEVTVTYTQRGLRGQGRHRTMWLCGSCASGLQDYLALVTGE
jgi:hypothetical protein